VQIEQRDTLRVQMADHIITKTLTIKFDSNLSVKIKFEINYNTLVCPKLFIVRFPSRN